MDTKETTTVNKLKSEIQNKVLSALKLTGYNGTVVLDMGTGKSKIGIDSIKDGGFKNILITSPRTNLKNNWRKELNRWGFANTDTDYLFLNEQRKSVLITIENIQTCYNWDKERLLIENFDLIIADEVHLLSTPEYGSLIVNARELQIPVLALTGTPNTENEYKSEFYQNHIPVVFEYLDSAKDGLINKRKYLFYFYDLSNEDTVQIVTKKRNYTQGEKARYEYIQNKFESSAKIIADNYFADLKGRVEILIKKGELVQKDAQFLLKAVSKDLEYFYEVTKPRYEKRDLSYPLYKALKLAKGFNYSILGLKSFSYMQDPLFPEELKSHLAIYNWAMRERKQFLWNLSSSAKIAKEIGKKILSVQGNKVLYFSELTVQAEKLSSYSVHSKNKKGLNDELIELFDKGSIKELSSCNSLTLGLNLVGANYAIMESYSGSPTSFLQKAGRTNRLSVNDTATVIFIVPKNTQAQQWFESLTRNVEDYEVIENLNDFEL